MLDESVTRGRGLHQGVGQQVEAQAGLSEISWLALVLTGCTTERNTGSLCSLRPGWRC